MADNLVLTAAHCVRARRSGSTDVVVGADNLCRGAPVQGQRLHVDRVILHPRARDGGVGDAALLVLDGRAHAAPARPASGDSSSPATGTEFGWGRNGYGGVAPCRRTAVPLRFVAADRCARAQRDLGLTPNPAWQSCAVPGAGASRNTCNGDSGSPVMADSGPAAFVALVSWGPSCRIGDVGVYVRVMPLQRWIAAFSSTP